ncbi:MAG: hypothetical protein JSS09_06605, partial [Verrucomicrobia bacterium]|nr:hypothetical protein [Verrucomicrobiota bacterium]
MNRTDDNFEPLWFRQISDKSAQPIGPEGPTELPSTSSSLTIPSNNPPITGVVLSGPAASLQRQLDLIEKDIFSRTDLSAQEKEIVDLYRKGGFRSAAFSLLGATIISSVACLGLGKGLTVLGPLVGGVSVAAGA